MQAILIGVYDDGMNLARSDANLLGLKQWGRVDANAISMSATRPATVAKINPLVVGVICATGGSDRQAQLCISFIKLLVEAGYKGTVIGACPTKWEQHFMAAGATRLVPYAGMVKAISSAARVVVR
jgi:hypothetical protein